MSHSNLIPRIERLLGLKIQSCRTIEGGYTPATRLLCKTDRGHFFVKVGATSLTSEYLRREIHAYKCISGPFMPTLIAWEEHQTEPLLIIEDLSDHHWPPPWDNRQADLVLSQIATMHGMKMQLESHAQVHGKRSSSWQKVAEDPRPFLSIGIADEQWLNKALPALVSNEARCQIEGSSLTHWDLRSDNMCLTKERAIFIDWNNACLSNPKLDLGFWLPSLAYEGGPLPDQIMPDEPEIAAWVSGFFAARAGLPGISDAPRVRLVQRQQLETALPWAARALGLSPPTSK